jgi:hypothetical protein
MSKGPSPLEIDKFFRVTIAPVLGELEAERRKIVLTFIFCAIPTLIAAALFFPFSGSTNGHYIMCFILGFGFIGLPYLLTMNAQKNFREKFKSHVMGGMVKAFFPAMKYSPDDHLPEALYNNADFFSSHEYYEGNDLFSGTIGNSRFQFSDLYTYRIEGSGKHRRTVNVFRGLFFCGDFECKMGSRTMIKPDVAESTFGVLGRGLQRVSSGGRLVDLEDTEFEKLFVVTSDDQVEARVILTPVFMEKLRSFRHRAGCEVYLCFVDSKMFLAIYNNRDLFEPRFWGEIVSQRDVSMFIESLVLMFSVAEEFLRAKGLAQGLEAAAGDRAVAGGVPGPSASFKEICDYIKSAPIKGRK